MHLPRLAEKEKTVAGQGAFVRSFYISIQRRFWNTFQGRHLFATQENDKNHTLKITAALGGSRREIKTTSV